MEISKVAKDAMKDTSIRYGWREWIPWLRLMEEAGELLGLRGSYQGTDSYSGSFANGEGYSNPSGMDGQHAQQREQRCDNDSDGRTRSRMTRITITLVDRWGWSWLDDNGPLFSSMTESQWILERLCGLFEGVVRKELECRQKQRDESDDEEWP
jgi:potassium channel subfamily K